MTATTHAPGIHLPLPVLALGLALALAGPALAAKKGTVGTGSGRVNCAAAETACNGKCKTDNPKSETGAALCTAGCGASRVICDLAHPKALRSGAGTVAPAQPALKGN